MADFIPQAHQGHGERHGCGCRGECPNCPRRHGAARGEQAPGAPKQPPEAGDPVGA